MFETPLISTWKLQGNKLYSNIAGLYRVPSDFVYSWLVEESIWISSWKHQFRGGWCVQAGVGIEKYYMTLLIQERKKNKTAVSCEEWFSA